MRNVNNPPYRLAFIDHILLSKAPSETTRPATSTIEISLIYDSAREIYHHLGGKTNAKKMLLQGHHLEHLKRRKLAFLKLIRDENTMNLWKARYDKNVGCSRKS